MDLLTGLDQFYKQVLDAATKERVRKRKARRGGCDAWRKFQSRALAVHSRQVEAANARAKRHGIAVEYDKKGRCRISGPAARKQLMKLEGMHDESGYGGIYG